MSRITLIATATFGLEAVVARELRELGYEDQMVENGKVTFAGDEGAICRTNLWLRTADRVLLKMGEFEALTFDELFEKTKALPWPDWIPEDAAFPVSGKSVKSQLFSVSDCQAIVKKAIVEKMKQKYKRDWFEETGAGYSIEVALLKDMATLTIDTSGVGLHKRGYRKLGSQAPLKETLAAAMVLLSRWSPGRPFLDPFCGSGTIPIEAALIGMNRAPGLNRDFAAEKWPVIASRFWHEAREEARELAHHTEPLHISGSDQDNKVLSLAHYHARQAGVAEKMVFKRLPVADIHPRDQYGYIICNPPYGERIGDRKQVERLYREMGRVFRSLDSWSYYILAAHPGFERIFGQKSNRKRKLYNGRLQCNFYQYHGPRPPRKMVPEEKTTV